MIRQKDSSRNVGLIRDADHPGGKRSGSIGWRRRRLVETGSQRLLATSADLRHGQFRDCWHLHRVWQIDRHVDRHLGTCIRLPCGGFFAAMTGDKSGIAGFDGPQLVRDRVEHLLHGSRGTVSRGGRHEESRGAKHQDDNREGRPRGAEVSPKGAQTTLDHQPLL